MIAVGCIGVAALAVGGLVYDDSLSKFIPYVVERDHLGDAVAVGLASKAAPPDLRTIQAELSRWLYDVRVVSPDIETEKHMILEAYDHTDGDSPAKGELDEWFSKNVPWERAKETIVTITVTSMLPTYPGSWHTWRGNWREEARTRDGVLVSSALKEVSLEAVQKTPTTDTAIKKNPAGVFVHNFDWKN
jgi:type IV secretion system protein VirB5